jgi:hypothetical protein
MLPWSGALENMKVSRSCGPFMEKYARYRFHKKSASDPYLERGATLNLAHCFKTISDTVMLADSGFRVV